MPLTPDPDRQPTAGPQPSSAFLAGIVATGLATAVGAFLTSYLGVQGTLIGASSGAMLAASANQILRAPLDRLERRLIQAGFSAVRLRHQGLIRGVLSTQDAPVKLWRALPRRAVLGTLGVAAAGFLLGMTGITAIEAAQDRPISALTTGAPQRGTTASNLVTSEGPGGAMPATATLATAGVAGTATPTRSGSTATARVGTPTSTAGPATPTIRTGTSTATPPRGGATATEAGATQGLRPTEPAGVPTAPARPTPTAASASVPTSTPGRLRPTWPSDAITGKPSACDRDRCQLGKAAGHGATAC